MFSRFMFGVTVVALLVLCVALWRALDVPVRTFVIEGELTDREQAEIRKRLAAGGPGGILSTDLERLAGELETLPWARKVAVRRGWPDRLMVSLHTAKPVARWGEGKYLSAYGDLMALPDDYPGLPQFVVAVSTPQQAMEVHRLLDGIAAREALTIQRLEQNAQGEWRIELAQGLTVMLGAEQLNQRMHRFLLLYRRVLREDGRIASYVDARYANGVAVRFDPGMAPDASDETLLASRAPAIESAEGNE